MCIATQLYVPLCMNGKGHNWRIRDTFYKTLKLWLEDARNVRIMGGIAGMKTEKRLTWPSGNGHVLSRVRRACQSVIVRNEKCTRKSRLKSVHCTHGVIDWLHDRAIVQNFPRMSQWLGFTSNLDHPHCCGWWCEIPICSTNVLIDRLNVSKKHPNKIWFWFPVVMTKLNDISSQHYIFELMHKHFAYNRLGERASTAIHYCKSKQNW